MENKKEHLKRLLNEPNELTEMVDKFIADGYKLNGHSNNKELILYLLITNGVVRLIKEKRFLFWKYKTAISITG